LPDYIILSDQPFAAGGYDAVWVLVINPTSKYQVEGDEKPSARVEKVWQEWTKLDVSPLLAEESMEGGARLEDVDAVPGLKAAISVA
jgi:phosphomevalonate kinase